MAAVLVGLLDTVSMEVVHAPHLVEDMASWEVASDVGHLDEALQKEFGVTPSEYVLLRKNGQMAVQYLTLPSPSLSPRWIKGAYQNITSTAVFDGAVGAMIGAALGVTFHGMDQAGIATMLHAGVNERTFVPFFLDDSGILNITGSAFSSKIMDVHPGGTPPSFSSEIFSALDTFVYDGRRCIPPSCVQADNGFRQVGYTLGYAISSGSDILLPATDLSIEDLCKIARLGGVGLCQRLAVLCCELGMRHGNNFFPVKWKEAVAKPKNSMSVMQFIYKLQTQLGFVLCQPQ